MHRNRNVLGNIPPYPCELHPYERCSCADDQFYRMECGKPPPPPNTDLVMILTDIEMINIRIRELETEKGVLLDQYTKLKEKEILSK